jgi:peroxiredoxin
MASPHMINDEVSTAPDFSLKDITGRIITLADYRQQKNVILVFNRGFA